MTNVTDFTKYKNNREYEIELDSGELAVWSCMECGNYDAFMLTEAHGVVCSECGTTHEVLDIVFKIDKD